jgi:hypothetical protein
VLQFPHQEGFGVLPRLAQLSQRATLRGRAQRSQSAKAAESTMRSQIFAWHRFGTSQWEYRRPESTAA